MSEAGKRLIKAAQEIGSALAWRSIETAPKDGTWFKARAPGVAERETQFGKTSHVPLYGWCFIKNTTWREDDCEPDYDLWSPTEWKPIT